LARKSPKKATVPPQNHLTPAEMSLLERLVDRGVLVTVPAVKSQKPRKVIAAALATEDVELRAVAVHEMEPAPALREKEE
jgi:hypothetical protein